MSKEPLYRGTSLIRNHPSVGTYSSPTPRALTPNPKKVFDIVVTNVRAFPVPNPKPQTLKPKP